VILKRINQEHVNIVKSQENDKSLKSINEVTNAQHRHQKVFVETDHTDHNILSLDAANATANAGWIITVDMLWITTHLFIFFVNT
jgi:hypothetical protein